MTMRQRAMLAVALGYGTVQARTSWSAKPVHDFSPFAPQGSAVDR